MTERSKFYKQTFIVTVLSKGGTVSCTDAEDFARITNCEDVVINVEESPGDSEVLPVEMAHLLIKCDSDPEYFGLNQDGTYLEEDCD